MRGKKAEDALEAAHEINNLFVQHHMSVTQRTAKLQLIIMKYLTRAYEQGLKGELK